MEYMSDLEKKLLANVLEARGGADDDGLFAYQAEALRQLRQIMRYLERKYPDAQLEYKYFEPIVRISEKGVLICSVQGSSLLHRAVLRRLGDSDVCQDDLYGPLIRERYDEALTEILAGLKGLKKVYTSFLSMVPEEIDGDSSIRRINAFRPRIRRHTDLFAAGTDTVSEELKEKLKEQEFFGSYSVYRVSQQWVFAEKEDKYEGLEQTDDFRITEESSSGGGA